jgi:two-component system cell cycle sensor histidine kinase/response regulator CckA
MNTIRGRLLTAMMLTGLVPLGVVLVPLASTLQRKLRESEEAKLADTATQLGRLVAEVTDRTARELGSLQSNPLLTESGTDIETKLAEMRRLVRIYEVYQDISLYDSDGYLAASTAEDAPAFREYSDWFRKARAGATVISHPQRVLGKEGLYLTVYLPIEASGESKGEKEKVAREVIKARLSFARIVSILEETALAADHSIVMLDSLGNLISGGAPERLMEKFDPSVAARRWIDAPTGVYVDPDGTRHLYASRILPAEVTKIDSPWIVLAMRPMSAAMAVARQSLLALVAVALFMMTLAAVLGIFLSRLISRPLENVGEVAERVASGDLSARADEAEGAEETRRLASLFNRMVVELAEHRESLERLVASRTESLHRSQADLERANARLQAAIESTNNGFLVEDLFGEIAVVNDLFLSSLGFEPGEASHLGTESLVDAFAERGVFDAARADRWLDRRRCGGVIDEEVVLQLPCPRTLQVYSAPIRDLRGSLIGRVWSTQDLTERRHLEEGLRQSQKMEAVGQLAGGVAHDFNNLLAGILGNLALVKMDLGENAGKEARESLAHAIKAGERAAELVKQLLGFSRRSRLDLKPCDANLVLTEVRDLLTATIDPRIRIELDLVEGPWRAMADVGMLGQVIMNMAVNAKDAMPSGGRLVLGSGNCVLSPEELRAHPEVVPGDFVRLTVEDDGEGMPPEVQAKIFEPFFTTKAPGKGTGLGLATSFGIVRQLGGWIDFRSAPGEGTRFDIYLPRNRAAEEAASAVLPGPGTAPELAPSRTGETILLVDDEALVRRIGRTLLSKLGYKIIEAADGLEAVELCRARGEHIDLVLLDLTMPNLTGKETFARLHEMRPELPVLICSGYLVDLDEFTRECGACPEGFVQKPYSFEDMAEMVRRTLDERVRAA